MTDTNGRTGKLRRAFPAAVVTSLLLAGCVTVGPDYVEPKVSTADQWSTELGRGLVAAPLSAQTLASWWEAFNDPILTNLIHLAIADNLDLRKAQARVREARAQHGMSAAARFPTFSADGGFRRNSSSKESGNGSETDLYNLGFDASWELDLFGDKRRSLEAARAEWEATEEDLRDVLVSLLAEVALNYVELRSTQTRHALALANLNAQTETYNLTRWRFEAGLTTQLDVEQARFNLEQTRAGIPNLNTLLEQAKNRLAVLLGQTPGNLKEILADSKKIPLPTMEISVGVPAETLRRRPDVRRAERQLAAQTSRVGVATAARYPGFSLVGSIGLEALSFGNLFTSRALASSIGSNAGWTLFDAGRIRQNIAVQTALQEQALSQYEAAVLTALEDVENALLAYVDEQARQQALLAGTQAAQSAVDLALQEYSSGLIDFQVVLDTQRSLLSLQDQLATSEGEITANLIRLYKALGGGWTPMTTVSAEAGTDKQD